MGCISNLFSETSGDLARTDPELVQLFERFAFGDARAESGLDEKTRYLVLLPALIACQSVTVYKAMLSDALDAGMTPVEAKEISYHAIAYVGMAKAYDYIVAANEVFAERGIELPLAGQATTDAETRFDEGLAVQRGIFGPAIDAAYESAPADQLHIQRFLSANCFGDYYTRGGRTGYLCAHPCARRLRTAAYGAREGQPRRGERPLGARGSGDGTRSFRRISPLAQCAALHHRGDFGIMMVWRILV